jgi:hypothetical protein
MRHETAAQELTDLDAWLIEQSANGAAAASEAGARSSHAGTQRGPRDLTTDRLDRPRAPAASTFGLTYDVFR